ncbi:hypothetical protein [Spirosoma profusum]|nr:hypothetical protein [Spirosoma profusum]
MKRPAGWYSLRTGGPVSLFHFALYNANVAVIVERDNGMFTP